MNIGEMIRNEDGSVTGYVAEATYDLETIFFEKVSSNHESAPAFNLKTRSPRGRPVRVGSIWERAAKETGELYFGGYLDSSASGFVPIRLFRSRQDPRVWTVVRKQPQRNASSARDVAIPEAQHDQTGADDASFASTREDA